MWQLISNEFPEKNVNEHESIFSIGNGLIGFRGDFENPIKSNNCGTYINGVYENSEIQYGEKAFGFPEENESIINLFNPRVIRLYVDDEEILFSSEMIESFNTVLDMQKGNLKRVINIKTKYGKILELTITRIVSLEDQNLSTIKYEVLSKDYSGKIKISTSIENSSNESEDEEAFDPRLGKSNFKTDILENMQNLDENKSTFIVATKKSEKIIIAKTKDFTFGSLSEKTSEINKNGSEFNYTFEVSKNEKVGIIRNITLSSCNSENKVRKVEKLNKIINKLSDNCFDEIQSKQVKFLKDFWETSDISFKDNDELTKMMRFNLFQLLQSVGRNGFCSIASKGLSGAGYDGHYFWESEAYVLPVFLYSKPEIARSLLEYRFSILDNARQQAKLLGHSKGALYSWRSISGKECSAYYPAGSAQYHINADISFAIQKYFAATDDKQFIEEYGAEIVFETARLWLDVGHYTNKGFCIDGVTGPDEYTAVVNNNAYTNLMARENLAFAAKLFCSVKEHQLNLDKMLSKIGFEENEAEEFLKAAENMYVPYSNELKIYAQDDTFLSKKEIDHNKLKKPLLLNYHPLFIYRHQVCKQPDLILAELNLSDKFTKEQKLRDYRYYEKITTHDSSLSPCVFSIMGYEVGENKKGFDLFLETLYADVKNLQGNTKDGLHMANMAGAWGCVVQGFAGFRIYEGRPKFSPQCPSEIDGYTFKIKFKGRVIKVAVSKEKTEYELLEGKELKIMHFDEKVTINNKVVLEIGG